jgi:DNA integrity scanning protein DisA with diadenylate cyclase activity
MQKIFHFNKNYFYLTILLFAIEIIIAKYVHDDIIRPYVGDMLVIMLIYCFVKSFIATKVLPTTMAVLVFSYLIEAFQYFKIVNILGLQQYKIARIIIGTTFSWADIFMYTIGIAIVIFVEKRIENKMPSIVS